MLVNHANITEKNYRKLTLEISPEKVGMICTDTLSGKILWAKWKTFESDGSPAESHFHKLFLSEPELSQTYDQVLVLHDNGYHSFVPSALFDEDYLGSYLQFSTKVFETDFFSFDVLESYEMNNVFVPYANLNNLLADKFSSFHFQHSATGLVTRLLEWSKNIEERQVFAHIGPGRFELVVVQNQKLLLCNTFEFATKEDFLYYLLFTAEQLSLNPEQFKLWMLGSVSEEDELYQIAYKYVRHTAMLDTTSWSGLNGRSEEENRNHFSLYQS